MYHNQVFDCLRTMITNSKNWPDNHVTFVHVSNNRPQQSRWNPPLHTSIALKIDQNGLEVRKLWPPPPK